MYEYIERKAIRDALYDADAITMSGVKILNQFPVADVAPVRHGRWDDTGRYTFEDGSLAIRCTECGAALHLDEWEKYYWKYCPNCGCLMDGHTEGRT